MKTLIVAVAIAATAFASPAFAQCENCAINVSFTEAANDDSNNPAATVTGATGGYTALPGDGEKTSVTLTNYFANTDTSFKNTSVYNLLETAGEDAAISDQITFSRSGDDLLINFISDPARFLTGDGVDVMGSTVETGSSQTIFDSSLLRDFRFQALTVSAVSEAEAGPVPEPATWAMMLLGFGGMGLAMRRKRTLALAQTA